MTGLSPCRCRHLHAGIPCVGWFSRTLPGKLLSEKLTHDRRVLLPRVDNGSGTVFRPDYADWAAIPTFFWRDGTWENVTKPMRL
jgi:hypothetical protein